MEAGQPNFDINWMLSICALLVIRVQTNHTADIHDAQRGAVATTATECAAEEIEAAEIMFAERWVRR